MEPKKELAKFLATLPFFLAFSVVVLGITAFSRGLGINLVFMGTGLLVGWPLLDIDKILARQLELSEEFFHTFKIYILLFILTTFVITASVSAFGRGMVLGLLFHGFCELRVRSEIRIGAGLLGLAVILLLL